MFCKIKELLRKNQAAIIAIMALLAILAILYFMFPDIIGMIFAILLIAMFCNMENISTFIQQKIAEKGQEQAAVARQAQIIQSAIADTLFRGFSGQLGKILGIIPPQTGMDVFPSTIPEIQSFNGITKYYFVAHRSPGSQHLKEDVMKRVVNGYFKKIALSGLLPPAPGTPFQPYFYAVKVTMDTNLPNTIIFHIVYVDDLLTESYVENSICEEMESSRRQLVDTQPPDDEEF